MTRESDYERGRKAGFVAGKIQGHSDALHDARQKSIVAQTAELLIIKRFLYLVCIVGTLIGLAVNVL